MDTLGKRIKYLREHQNLKQSELAVLIGVKSGAVISNWEKDINKPDIDKLARICEVLNVSVPYMLNISDKKKRIFFSKDEAELIAKFRLLDSYGKKSISTLLNLEYIRTKNMEKSNYSNSESDIPSHKKDNVVNFVKIKVFQQRVSAGLGNYVFEDLEAEEMEFSKDDVPTKTDFAIRIKGDSMEPKICDGDLVWIKRQPIIYDNEIGIFMLNGESYCKKLLYTSEGLSLISLNKKYSPILVGEFDQFHTVGKVLL